MTELVCKQGGTAEPAAQKHEQFFFTAADVFGVQLTDELSLLCIAHDLVESLTQLSDTGFATDALVGCCNICHGNKLIEKGVV